MSNTQYLPLGFTLIKPAHSTFNTFDSVHSTGDCAVGKIHGEQRNMHALVVENATDYADWTIVELSGKDSTGQMMFDSIAVYGAFDDMHAKIYATNTGAKLLGMFDSVAGDVVHSNQHGLQRALNTATGFNPKKPIPSWYIDKMQDVLSGEKVMWDSVTLKSHGGRLDNLLLDMQRHDDNCALVEQFDSVEQVLAQYDDIEIMAYDGVFMTYSQLEKFAKRLHLAMDNASKASKVQVKDVKVSDPFKRQGMAQIFVLYTLDDGQSVTVFLHNPDSTPEQMQANDVLIAWKWVLNGRDVTGAVQSTVHENGNTGANVNILAGRIMQLVDKNSARFKRTQAKKEQQKQELELAQQRVTEKQAMLDKLNQDIELLQQKLDELQGLPKAQTQYSADNPYAQYASHDEEVKKNADDWEQRKPLTEEMLSELNRKAEEQGFTTYIENHHASLGRFQAEKEVGNRKAEIDGRFKNGGESSFEEPRDFALSLLQDGEYEEYAYGNDLDELLEKANQWLNQEPSTLENEPQKPSQVNAGTEFTTRFGNDVFIMPDYEERKATLLNAYKQFLEKRDDKQKGLSELLKRSQSDINEHENKIKHEESMQEDLQDVNLLQYHRIHLKAIQDALSELTKFVREPSQGAEPQPEPTQQNSEPSQELSLDELKEQYKTRLKNKDFEWLENNANQLKDIFGERIAEVKAYLRKVGFVSDGENRMQIGEFGEKKYALIHIDGHADFGWWTTYNIDGAGGKGIEDLLDTEPQDLAKQIFQRYQELVLGLSQSDVEPQSNSKYSQSDIDYLNSVINKTINLETVDMDKIIEIGEKDENDPLFEQALQVINDYTDEMTKDI